MTLAALVPQRRSHPPHLISAEGSPLREVEQACRRIAKSDASVLLTGETGTGKEVFARLVHLSSPRAAGPFIAVNCAAIPESLLESELFGHARGAFTGASGPREGRLQLANGGTLLLDEVGELPLLMQAKLLRVLQERVIEPIGSSQGVESDFRLIAATNRDLLAEVEAGRFRADLYYRLLVCPLELPPLRNRTQDIPVLFRHFLDEVGEQRAVEEPLLRRILSYRWPGNVRELQNLAERLAVCAAGATLQASDLPPHFGEPAANSAPDQHGGPSGDAIASALATPARPSLPVNLAGMLRELEDSYIQAALDQAEGNKTIAAELLGLQRTTLVEKLRRRSSSRDAETA